MGIPFKVIVKNVKKEDHEIIAKAVDLCFEEIDTKLNGWNKNSEIALWNAQKSTKPIKISNSLHEIIEICDLAHEKTSGRFDPSLGKIIAKWKQVLKMGAFLSNTEIMRLAPSLGWDKISIYRDGYLQKHHKDVEIDLDGISKGYFCDICIKHLENKGFTRVLVEWGGEIKTLGDFKVLIKGKIVPISNISVATSGYKYQIYPIDLDGTLSIYSHFIDPKTYKPIIVQGLEQEETIFHKSCALADALATSKYL